MVQDGAIGGVVQHRQLTPAELATEVLLDGEIAVGLDGNGEPSILRMGDGATTGGAVVGTTHEVSVNPTIAADSPGTRIDLTPALDEDAVWLVKFKAVTYTSSAHGRLRVDFGYFSSVSGSLTIGEDGSFTESAIKHVQSLAVYNKQPDGVATSGFANIMIHQGTLLEKANSGNSVALFLGKLTAGTDPSPNIAATAYRIR
ncbi:hypothetical protein [Crateriforma conspicua]|uniref:hypothetical protein n=1 Tax=Crateriforma TaxID=2714592 RepID=UPI0011B42E0D|nr:hypothetical protein [Crateriforma conspicua]